MRLFGLGGHKQSGGGHVETVHEQRASGIWTMIVDKRPYRLLRYFSWYREHSGRFAQHDNPFVFVDNLRNALVGLLPWIVVHIYALEHKGEDRKAFAPTGGVVAMMAAQCAHR